jgi:2,5-diamino-6-(ribosylamino)-4(3H)-pyrimidinone 5'-phosphate reductase
VAVLTAGSDRVDLAAALEQLASEYGVCTLRADSGGRLNTALLQAGLVDEVSLLLHPYLVGPAQESFVRNMEEAHSGEPLGLRLLGVEPLENDLVWVRYEVTGGPGPA